MSRHSEVDLSAHRDGQYPHALSILVCNDYYASMIHRFGSGRRRAVGGSGRYEFVCLPPPMIDGADDDEGQTIIRRRKDEFFCLSSAHDVMSTVDSQTNGIHFLYHSSVCHNVIFRGFVLAGDIISLSSYLSIAISTQKY